MNLELTTEQQELREVATRVLDDRAPLSLARSYLDGHGAAPALWNQVKQLGWYTVGTDEDPFGIPGLVLITEQCGAHAAPTLMVDTAVAVRLAGAAPEPSALLASVAEGQEATSLAALEREAGWDLTATATEAVVDGDGYRLSGTKHALHHAAVCDVVAIVARVNGELATFFVRTGTPGLELTPEELVDPTAAASRLDLNDLFIPAHDAVLADAGASVASRAFAVGTVATAAESIGAASRALDMAVAYAIERHQFGRAIGRFQAVQHLLAEAHVLRETGWSAVLYAAAALEENTPDATHAVSIAKAHTARASRVVLENALQVMAGIGFTWEHDLHLLQRRVLEAERRFGDAIDHERRIDGILRASFTEALA